MKTFTATFADGDQKHRNASRPYTHGWRVRYSYLDPHRLDRQEAANYGFASDARSAHKDAARARKQGGPSAVHIIDCEIVSLTSKETT